MSDDDPFLARWSRRKRRKRVQPSTASAEDSGSSEGTVVPEGSTETVPPIDLAKLPPIEAIEADSDIRAFLAPGVPAGLARAALRRAWSADPAIRDFIGLSENSWDFTAPNGVPGFGSLSADEVRRLLKYLTKEADSSEAAEAPGLGPVSAAPDQTKREPASDREDKDSDQAATTGIKPVQRDDERCGSTPPRSRKHHGGALPE